MKQTLKKTQAAKIIEEHFRVFQREGGETVSPPGGARLGGETVSPPDDVLVSARMAGRRMVEIYRLLTGEMPQSPGIEVEYRSNELPGVEFSSPLERDPSELYYAHPGDPDILIPGDDNGQDCVDRRLEEKESPERAQFRRVQRGRLGPGSS